MTRIRPVEERDLEALAEMIDDFVSEHPAHDHPRPREALREACLGQRNAARMLVAERHGVVIGFVVWQPVFDFFWSMWGAEVGWLYVVEEARGHALALRLIARVAADVRAFGGEFLHATYGEDMMRLYEMVAEGSPGRGGYVAAERFQTLADLQDDVRGLVHYARKRKRPTGS